MINIIPSHKDTCPYNNNPPHAPCTAFPTGGKNAQNATKL